MPLKKTFAFVLLSFIFVTGCGPKLPDGMPDLYPVTVTVTQDGSPLEGADVVLKGSEQWTPIGTTDAQGIAVLYTQGNYVGAPEGTFKVTVTKVGAEGEKPPPNPFDAESARVFQEYQKSGKTYKQFYLVPEQYRKPESTPLQVEIKSDVKNVTVNVEGTVKEEIRSRGAR